MVRAYYWRIAVAFKVTSVGMTSISSVRVNWRCCITRIEAESSPTPDGVMPRAQSGGTQAGEPVEDRCPYLQLSHLPLEVPSHHAFAQSLEASHLVSTRLLR